MHRDRRQTGWNKTPAETPRSKIARAESNGALFTLLEHILYRLRVSDKAQAYIIDKVEDVPESMSLARVEREELDDKSRDLLRDWADLADGGEERQSQSNITVTTIVEPTKKSSFPSLSPTKVKRAVILVAIIVGGVAVGVVQALKLLGVMK